MRWHHHMLNTDQFSEIPATTSDTKVLAVLEMWPLLRYSSETYNRSTELDDTKHMGKLPKQ